MSRRSPALVALFALIAFVACQGTPSAPELTDPKEILVQSTATLADVKSVSIAGRFDGNVSAPGMGEFDLSTLTMAIEADVDAKKARIQVDAPSLLGTKADVIVVPEGAFIKVTGPLAGMMGLDPTGKYTRQDVDSTDVPDAATDPDKAVEELRENIDKLPAPPEKLADEKCGDQDCYHVRIALTAEQLAALSPDAAGQAGAVTFDVWARKNDLRPAKVSFSIETDQLGTIGGTFEFTYDQSITIQAPPDSEVVPGS